MPAAELSESWQLTVPAIPERSRLYSLEPMRVGTADVESLTGYVARLAEAHCITVADLVGAELSDPASSTPLLTPHPGKNRSNVFYTQFYSINGIGGTPKKWVNVLEAATLRQGLSDLTFLAFDKLFAQSFLFRNVRAWCPSCLESRRRFGVPYESLLWAISIVKICPLHEELLEEICPHCHRRAGPLAAHSRPGYCSRCRGWLGRADPQRPAEKPLVVSELERETWIAKSVGELLAAGPELKDSPLRQHLSSNLSACVDAVSYGNLLAFGDLTRTPRGALRGWVSNTHRPEIGALLRMCYYLRVPVTALLRDPTTAEFDITPLPNDRGIRQLHQQEHIRHVLEMALVEEIPPSVSEVARRLNYVRTDRLYQIDRTRCQILAAKHREALRGLQRRNSKAPRKCESSHMKHMLEDSLAREHPVSVAAIATQLGYANAGCLRGEFPDLCRAIGQKIAQQRRTEIERRGEIMKTALEEDPPPTAEDMAGRLGYASTRSLRRNFPTLYDALLTRRRACKAEEKVDLQAGLISALMDDPAPGVAAVCKRLGVSPGLVYRRHADLARAIAARHLRQRAESVERRRELLREEVFEIVNKMHDRGERLAPARELSTRVLSMLSPGSLKGWAEIGRFLKEAKRYLRVRYADDL